MYFKKLELIGFKSFMNKTILHFEPGVTAIVGPNGCGKSNIVDSIRWVLGEQSVKSLRGSEMQDVIFNGTDSQVALGMAEVSLTFDNENKFFNLDHHEVNISRRIFRSGESEYLLNKVQVRLKDILDLLMGTGIGAESYSLVAQGKIDLILSSRPEDRRLIFDEAAGITKYKTQKREALKRLEETEQNLLRACDIIMEVKRQIGSLERQANKARRYKETFEELKSKEISLGLLQRNSINKEKNDLIASLKALKEEEEGLQGAIKLEEDSIYLQNQEISKFSADIEELKGKIADLENNHARDEQHIAFSRDRVTELKGAQGYLKEQIQQARNRLALDEEKLNKLKEEQSEVKKNIENKTLLLKEKEGLLNNTAESIRISLESIAQAKRSILESAASSAKIKNEITDLSAKSQIINARRKRLEIEKARNDEEKSGIEVNLGVLDSELKEIEKEAENLKLTFAGFKKEKEEGDLSLSLLNKGIEELEKQALTLNSYKDFLEKLKTQYEDITTSLNAVIYLDQPLPDKLSGLIIKVKDYLSLSPEDSFKNSGLRLKVSGEAKPIDLDAARVIEKIRQIEEKIAGLKGSKNEKEEHIRRLGLAIQELQGKQQQSQMAVADKMAVHKTVLEQFNKVKEEGEIISLELTETAENFVELGQKMNKLNLELSDSEKKHKDLEALMQKEEESININNILKEEIVILVTQTKTELEVFAKRISSEDSTFKTLEDNHLQDKEACLNLENQLKESKNKEEALIEEINELEKRISQDKEEVRLNNDSLKEKESEFNRISGSIALVIQKIETQKKGLDAFKDKAYGLHMSEKDLEFKYTSLRDRLIQAYKIDIDAHEVLSVVLVEAVDQNALCAEIDQLRIKLDSYGTVNLVAIEEYDELKKRYDFLIQQQGDLNKAKESLQEAIRKINQTTKKMFLETFERVKEEFKNYFRLLFNGGDAQLFLIDEQDPLESGIEIICRPPGKKLQNVLLLSGGEKSMAAIALIFAIFKVKPAPFCVLDEIDAALDEANVDRFARLLQDFTGNSQFIVITHNKRTIANANVMYGITMEQSGMSKIVSVKFASDKNKVEAQEDREPVAA